jgi:acyl-CoA thioester hydrolase
MIASEISVRVYWEDTDAGGIVYHANYLRFMERGRTELLRGCGLDQSALAAETDVTIAVRRMSIEFLAAARLDDVLQVRTALVDLRGASLLLRQDVLRDETPLVAAEVLVATVRDGRACRMPPAVLAVLKSS